MFACVTQIPAQECGCTSVTSKLGDFFFNKETPLQVEKHTDEQKGYAVPLMRLIFPGSVN